MNEGPTNGKPANGKPVNEQKENGELNLGYFVVFEHEIVGFDPSRRLEALTEASDSLDELAMALELPSLAEFSHLEADLLREVMDQMLSSSEFAEMTEFAEMKEGLNELTQEDLENEDWFDADDGLRWVVSVKTHLEREPAALGSLEGVTVPELLTDLTRLESTLERAHREGVRFHLELDY